MKISNFIRKINWLLFFGTHIYIYIYNLLQTVPLSGNLSIRCSPSKCMQRKCFLVFDASLYSCCRCVLLVSCSAGPPVLAFYNPSCLICCGGLDTSDIHLVPVVAGIAIRKAFLNCRMGYFFFAPPSPAPALNLKNIMSPSSTTYSFPFILYLPADLTAFSLPSSLKSVNFITSAIMNPFSKSV